MSTFFLKCLIFLAPLASAAARAPAPTNFAKALLPNETSYINEFSISSYGSILQGNKRKLNEAFVKCRTTPPHRALFVAMAMVETNTMSITERDASKDGRKDGAANVSIFNLSEDLVVRIGYAKPPRTLNDPKTLPEAVCLLQDGIKKFGLVPLLNFVRGGYTGWVTGTAYGTGDYRRTVASILKVIDAQPKLLTDDRRVEIYLKHV
jgi:hypothetical protein